MIPESLPCLVCGNAVEIEARDGVFHWTNDGIWMLETGNYGSTVLDDPPERLAVFMVLCDRCLVARRNRMRAVQLKEREKTSSHWKWLDELPERLIRGGAEDPIERRSRSFRCSCNMSVSGPGLTSATCGTHGSMREETSGQISE